VATGSVILIAVGARWAAEGSLKPGVLVAQGLYLSMIFSPLRTLLELYLKLQEGRVSLARFKEYLAVGCEVRSGRRPLPAPSPGRSGSRG